MAKLTSEAILPRALKKVSFATLDDMYATIGYGGLSAQKAVNKISDEIRQIEKAATHQGEEHKMPWGSRAEKTTKPIHGIIVEGVDNCLVKFSRCCTPVPGDNIVGFITRGYGVSVHRSDCSNYENSVNNPEDAGRWINVSWADTGDEKYQTALKITARERDGLVMDVATVLNSLKVRVDSLSARNIGGGVATVFMTIEVKDRYELGAAMTKLSGISGVTDVKRAGTAD